jgi:hypothetical protein
VVSRLLRFTTADEHRRAHRVRHGLGIGKSPAAPALGQLSTAGRPLNRHALQTSFAVQLRFVELVYGEVLTDPVWFRMVSV